MPSFLSKVFGRKKDDRISSPTNPGELLGGKFEAISPTVSPTAANYLELPPDATKVPAQDTDAGRTNSDEKDVGLPFFRIKSRPSSPGLKPKKVFDSLPPLSLDFQDLKDKSAYNGYIFEESNSGAIFSDAVLGQRLLNPVEALLLIRTCSKAIISRGLETLGIMTPHWHSASPDNQRRLISQFLRSLDLSDSIATSSSPHVTSFEDEVNFTRSIHDIAAVFRWSLRHVQLESDSFGTDDGWYKAFLEAEAANSYPPKAFSENLSPRLPTSHFDLLVSTLEVFSSLAAFSELNGASGSKLSKIFGLWMLAARRVEHKDDWKTFYSRWQRTGCMLEHLFLARIRDQSADKRMPIRLLELVHKYPYTQGLSSPTTDLQLLSTPQFTTALHPALFVRVQYEVLSQERIPKTKINPSVLVADAFSTKVEEGEFAELWAKITKTSSKHGTELPLSNVFASESLRLLSLLEDKTKEVKSPAFSLISLIEPKLQRSISGAGSMAHTKLNIDSAPLSSSIGSDWEQFSNSGFLDANPTLPNLTSTLFDSDVEKTEPRDIPLPISRKSSWRSGRKSGEARRSVVISDSPRDSSLESTRQDITASHLEVVDLDEAFVDFWSDALLDPIASGWPTFVICKFKPSLVPQLTFGADDEATRKSLRWLVLEQVYSVKPRPILLSSPLTPLPASAAAETPIRSASPITHSPSGRRRFNFWSVSRTPSSSSTGSPKAWKPVKTPRVGEMGELIEEEVHKDTTKVRAPRSRRFKSLDIGVRKSKKADKMIEKTKSADHTKRESKGPPDLDAGIPSSSTVVIGAVVAAGAATIAASTSIQKGPEEQTGDIVKDLSGVPETIRETVEPVLQSGDAAKQDVIVAAETDAALSDDDKADVATIHAVVSDQDAPIVDAGIIPESAIPDVQETGVISDKRTSSVVTKDQIGNPILGDEENHIVQGVDRPKLVSEVPNSDSISNQPLSNVALPIQQDEEVEKEVITSSSDPEDTVDSVLVPHFVAEGGRAPSITAVDVTAELSQATSGDVGVEDISSLERTTAIAFEQPNIEIQATPMVNADVGEKSIEEVPLVDKRLDSSPAVDEALATAIEARSDHETSTSVVVDEPIIVKEAPPEQNEHEQRLSIQSAHNSLALEKDITNEEILETTGLMTDPLLEEVGKSTINVDSDAVETNLEVPKLPPVLNDVPIPVTEVAVDLSTSERAAVLQEVPNPTTDSAGEVVETFSPVVVESVETGSIAGAGKDDSLSVETALEEPQTVSKIPVQEVTSNETNYTPETLTSQEVNDGFNATVDEGRLSADIGVGGVDAEIPTAEESSIIPNLNQAIEPEPIFQSSVDASITEPQEFPTDLEPVSAYLPENSSIVTAPSITETVLEIPSSGIAKPEAEVPPEPDLGESLGETEPAPGARAVVEEIPFLAEGTLEPEGTPVSEIHIPHDEPLIETAPPVELSSAEPEAPLEATVENPAVSQLVAEQDLATSVPLAEVSTSVEKDESDTPMVIESLKSEGETSPEFPEQIEGARELVSTAEEVPVVELPPFPEGEADDSTPLDDVTINPEGATVVEETQTLQRGAAVVDVLEQTAAANEDRTSESVTVSVPDVFEDASATGLTDPETTQPIIDDSPAGIQLVSQPPNVPSAIESEPSVIVEPSAAISDPIVIDSEALSTSDEPGLPADVPATATESTHDYASTTIGEDFAQEPLHINLDSVEETILDENPLATEDTSTSVEASTGEEVGIHTVGVASDPSAHDESTLGMVPDIETAISGKSPNSLHELTPKLEEVAGIPVEESLTIPEGESLAEDITVAGPDVTVALAEEKPTAVDQPEQPEIPTDDDVPVVVKNSATEYETDILAEPPQIVASEESLADVEERPADGPIVVEATTADLEESEPISDFIVEPPQTLISEEGLTIIDQPIHSQEIENPKLEERPTNEPILVESTSEVLAEPQPNVGLAFEPTLTVAPEVGLPDVDQSVHAKEAENLTIEDGPIDEPVVVGSATEVVEEPEPNFDLPAEPPQAAAIEESQAHIENPTVEEGLAVVESGAVEQPVRELEDIVAEPPQAVGSEDSEGHKNAMHDLENLVVEEEPTSEPIIVSKVVEKPVPIVDLVPKPPQTVAFEEGQSHVDEPIQSQETENSAVEGVSTAIESATEIVEEPEPMGVVAESSQTVRSEEGERDVNHLHNQEGENSTGEEDPTDAPIAEAHLPIVDSVPTFEEGRTHNDELIHSQETENSPVEGVTTIIESATGVVEESEPMSVSEPPQTVGSEEVEKDVDHLHSESPTVEENPTYEPIAEAHLPVVDSVPEEPQTVAFEEGRKHINDELIHNQEAENSTVDGGPTVVDSDNGVEEPEVKVDIVAEPLPTVSSDDSQTDIHKDADSDSVAAEGGPTSHPIVVESVTGVVEDPEPKAEAVAGIAADGVPNQEAESTVELPVVGQTLEVTEDPNEEPILDTAIPSSTNISNETPIEVSAENESTDATVGTTEAISENEFSPQISVEDPSAVDPTTILEASPSSDILAEPPTELNEPSISQKLEHPAVDDPDPLLQPDIYATASSHSDQPANAYEIESSNDLNDIDTAAAMTETVLLAPGHKAGSEIMETVVDESAEVFQHP